MQAVAAGHSHSTLSLFAHETKPNQSRHLSQDAHTSSIARVLLGLWVEAIPGQLPNLHTKPFLCEGSCPPANRAECPARGSPSLWASPLPDCPGAGRAPRERVQGDILQDRLPPPAAPSTPEDGEVETLVSTVQTQGCWHFRTNALLVRNPGLARHSSPDARVARGGERTSGMILLLLSPLRRLAARARQLSTWHRAQAAPSQPGSTHYVPG